MKKLILIGNGFDLAHQLNTSYYDFKEKNRWYWPLICFRWLVFAMERDTERDGCTEREKTEWYSFEENIQRVTRWVLSKQFMQSEKPIPDYKDYDRKMCLYNRMFQKISKRLMKFLAKVTAGEIHKIESVENEFSGDCFTVNFNYTDTVKIYGKDCYYIHGSIKGDGEIILGFADSYKMSDFATGQYARFNKEVLKDRLDFIRYLGENNIKPVKSILRRFEQHILSAHSGKGEYDYPYVDDEYGGRYDTGGDPEIIVEYFKRNNFAPKPDPFDVSDVEEIVIMGHGLKSDNSYIEGIFYHARQLKSVCK